MKQIIINTADGSHTLFVPELNEHYHSVNGAIIEAKHIFIDAGFHFVDKKLIRILEIGFGTGLNAFLTCVEAINNNVEVYYHSIEKYPINLQTVSKLNYVNNYETNKRNIFYKMHISHWGKDIDIDKHFIFKKIKTDFNDYNIDEKYDIIYFDAFSPDVQAEMWELDNFIKLYNCLNPNGIIVTYSAKGIVKRNLRSAGFTVKRLPGPPGKRHILRAIKE